MVANDLLMQMQADLLDAEVVRPRDIETTALGAAFAAGLGAGRWATLDEVAALPAVDRSWSPQMTAEQRAGSVAVWERAVERSYGWEE